MTFIFTQVLFLFAENGFSQHWIMHWWKFRWPAFKKQKCSESSDFDESDKKVNGNTDLFDDDKKPDQHELVKVGDKKPDQHELVNVGLTYDYLPQGY